MRALARALGVVACLAALPHGAGAFQGDLDGDCRIDVSDVALLERHLTGEAPLPTAGLEAADVAPLVSGEFSADGEVDVGDLVALTRAVAGEVPFPEMLSPAPTLDALPAEAPSNPIPLSGTAPAGSTVSIFVNGRLHPAKPVATSGTFSLTGISQVALEDGVNEIVATAELDEAVTCTSQPVTTSYTNDLDRTIDAGEGTIDGDQFIAWTPGVPPQPYVINTDLVIKRGSQLVLLPGTELRLADGVEIIVESHLNPTVASLMVLGVEGNPVRLVSSSSPSCSVRWGGLRFASRRAEFGNNYLSSLVEHAYIECAQGYAIRAVSPGGVTVRYTEVTRSPGAVSVAYNANYSSIWNNYFHNLGQSAVLLSRNVGFGNNTIVDVGNNGIHLNGDTTYDDFSGGNLIQGADGAGIFVGPTQFGTGFVDVTITGNTITGNCTGISATDGFTGPPTYTYQFAAHDNAIYDNNSCSGGCQVSPSRCRDLNVDAASCNSVVDATENWWGETELSAITGRIRACANVVDFSPWLSGPPDAGGTPVDEARLAQGSINDDPGGKPAGSQWFMLGDVLVEPDKTLTIPAGTQLEFLEGARLIVEGTLDVQGTEASPVVFTALMPPGEPPVKGHWDGVVVQAGGDATISGAVFEYASTSLTVTGGASQLDVTTSRFVDHAQTAIRIENGAAADVHGNRNVAGTLGIFGGSSGTGISIDGVSSGLVSITENDISGGTNGVWIDDASPALHANLIENAGNAGIQITGSGTAIITDDTGNSLPGNEITGNCRGITIAAPSDQPTPQIHENSIHDNDRCPGISNGNRNLLVSAYGSTSSIPIAAQDNWWGSSDVATIASLIIDRSENPNLPIVDFIPFYQDAGLSSPVDPAGYLLGPQSSLAGTPGDELPSGTYYVAGVVQVADDEIWRIGPGVTLEMTAGAGIEVAGSLKIAGTSGSVVLIRGIGGTTWDGIKVSGTDVVPPGAPKLDLAHATIQDAVTAVQASGTGSNLVSITDSRIEDFNVGLHLTSVGNGLIRDNEIDNLTKLGTGILLANSDVTVEGNTIERVASGISVTGSASDVAIGSIGAGNVIQNFNWTGISLHDVLGGSIIGNTISNSPTASPKRGTGIDLYNSLGTANTTLIQKNTLQHLDVGILVEGNSTPTIGGTTGTPHNTITDNRVGILIEGDPTGPASGAGQPLPEIHLNNIASNAVANLQVTDFPPAAAVVIDATQNWWGDTDVDVIRQSILMDAANPVAVDFSEYLSAADSTMIAGVTALFSTILAQVRHPLSVLTPTLTPGTPLQVDIELLANADSLSIEIYEDLDDARSLLVYQAACSGLVAGGQSCTWPGTDSEGTLTGTAGRIVPDGAYVFRIVATAAGKTFVHDPPRPVSGSRPTLQLAPAAFNVYANDFPKMIFKLTQKAGRIHFVMAETSQGPVLDEVLPWTPFPAGDDHYVVFDGRDDDGVLRSDLDQSRHFHLSGYGATPLKSNHVLVRKTTPQVRHQDFSASSDPPRIEVKADPYFVVLSYDQVTQIEYSLDQAAYVTIKILKPGFGDPDDPNAVVAILRQDELQAAGPHDIPWDPDPMQAPVDGAYTFAIEAVTENHSYLSSLYRGVIQVRQ